MQLPQYFTPQTASASEIMVHAKRSVRQTGQAVVVHDHEKPEHDNPKMPDCNPRCKVVVP